MEHMIQKTYMITIRNGICQFFYTSEIPDFFYFTQKTRKSRHFWQKIWKCRMFFSSILTKLSGYLQSSTQTQSHSSYFGENHTWIWQTSQKRYFFTLILNILLEPINIYTSANCATCDKFHVSLGRTSKWSLIGAFHVIKCWKSVSQSLPIYQHFYDRKAPSCFCWWWFSISSKAPLWICVFALVLWYSISFSPCGI